MASQHLVEVTGSFKIILKEILEKLTLPPAIFECKKHGLDHDLIFLATVVLDDGHEKNRIFRSKESTKKGAEQVVILLRIEHLKGLCNIVIRDVNYRELDYVKTKYSYTSKSYQKKIAQNEELKLKLKGVIDSSEESVRGKHDSFKF